MNFAVAVERAKALTTVPCEVVTVGDDTALESLDKTAGRYFSWAFDLSFLANVRTLSFSGVALVEEFFFSKW